MRTILPLDLLAGLAVADVQPTPLPPRERTIPDDEFERLRNLLEAEHTQETRARLLVGSVEREMERAEHYDPRTGERLYTVEAVLTCLRDHGSVTVQQPGLPAPRPGEEAPEAPPQAALASPQVIDPVNAPLSQETVAAILSARGGQCGWSDCGERATHAPVLLLRSLRSPDVHRLELPVGLCPTHQPKQVSDYLTDHGWRETVAAPLEAVGFKVARHLCIVKHLPLFGA